MKGYKNMTKRISILFLLMIAIFTVVCDDRSNPVPQIESIDPNAKMVSMPGFTMNVKGEEFSNASVVYFNGRSMSTVFHNTQELTAEITADVIKDIFASEEAMSGNDGITIEVYVNTSPPGGGKSNVIEFILRKELTLSEPKQVSASQISIDNIYLYVSNDDKLYIALNAVNDITSVALLAMKRLGQDEEFTGPNIVSEVEGEVGIGKKSKFSVDYNNNLFYHWNYTSYDNDKLWFAASLVNGTGFDNYLQPISTADGVIGDYGAGNFGTENLFAAWSLYLSEEEEEDGVNDETGVIQFSATFDLGWNFTEVQQLNKRPITSDNVAFALDPQGRITVGWSAKGINETKEGIYYTRSIDFGKTFLSPQRLALADNDGDVLRKPVCDVDNNGSVYFAWWERSSTNPSVYKVMTALSDETVTEFSYLTVDEFTGFFSNTLSEIHIKADSSGTVYVAVRSSDDYVNIYRKTTSSSAFVRICEPQYWENKGKIGFTVDNEGNLHLGFTKEVEYEDNEDEDEEPQVILELFYVYSN